MASRRNRHRLLNIALMLVSCGCFVGCQRTMPTPPVGTKVGDGNANPPATPLTASGPQAPIGQPTASGQPVVSDQPTVAPRFAGKRYVLLVGVQAYGSPEFPDLSFTENDVDELTAAMTQSGYFRENITVLTKNKAVPRDILQKLKVIADKCTKDDVLFVGFAGHGFERPNPSSPDQRQQFFCGYGARKDQPDTLVDLDQVYRILGDSRAGMKLIVMDACRNSLDRSLPPADPGHSSITSGNIPQGVLAFFSSSSGQRSFESPSLKHGVFFHYLIEAFQGKAQTTKGQLTWTNLVDHLENNVGSYVKKNLNQTQNWHFRGNVNIHLPLAEVASATPPPNPHPPGPVVRTIKLNRPIPSWDERIFITLEQIEIRNDRPMRWYFTFWNKCGVNRGASVRDSSYVTDQDGHRSNCLNTSIRQSTFGLPDGEKLAWWIDFQEPYSSAKILTARFTADSPNFGGGPLPQIDVDLDDPNGEKAKAKAAQEAEEKRIAAEKAAQEEEEKRKAAEEEKRKRALLPKRPGELILRTKVAILKDVTAWVEVDGKRTADWKVGTTEVKLTLLSGDHRVVVKSLVQKKELTIFDKEVEVVADKTTTIDVGP